MKTQISFTKKDGGQGLALVDGGVDDPLEARRELCAALNLPQGKTPGGDIEDVDSRLRAAGIDPATVTTVPVVE